MRCLRKPPAKYKANFPNLLGGFAPTAADCDPRKSAGPLADARVVVPPAKYGANFPNLLGGFAPTAADCDPRENAGPLAGACVVVPPAKYRANFPNLLMNLRSKNAPHAASRGFTLVEVIIAFALLALLAALMFQSFRYATRATDVGITRNEANEDTRRAQDFLRQHLEEMLPLRYQKEIGQPLRFVGDGQRVVYVAPVISRIAEGGVMWWELTARIDNENGVLTLRRAPMTGDESSPPTFDAQNESVLAENIRAAKMSFFDQPDPQLSGNWVENWTDDQRLPNLIRVEVTDRQGRAWPELIVAPQIAPSVGCPGRWNAQQKRCVIPGARQ
jgi:general secretion pathway protein J